MPYRILQAEPLIVLDPINTHEGLMDRNETLQRYHQLQDALFPTGDGSLTALYERAEAIANDAARNFCTHPVMMVKEGGG